MLSASDRERLVAILDRARERSIVGKVTSDALIDHALGFADATSVPPAEAVDLGTGAGIPGLVLALLWPDSVWTLVDSAAKRIALVELSIAELGVDDRVVAVAARAEEFARRPAERERYDLVAARSFAPPPVLAECGGPLLRVGGSLVVSEPPDPTPDRWPPAGLAAVGLAPGTYIEGPPGYRRLDKIEPSDAAHPRAVGTPARRPLW